MTTTSPARERPALSLCSREIGCHTDQPRADVLAHGDRCAWLRADRHAWQRWYDAKKKWEAKAEADIKNGVLSIEALDYIQERDGTRYGDMSTRIEYMVTLLRKELKDG